jgi:hypothetical protein
MRGVGEAYKSFDGQTAAVIARPAAVLRISRFHENPFRPKIFRTKIDPSINDICDNQKLQIKVDLAIHKLADKIL